MFPGDGASLYQDYFVLTVMYAYAALKNRGRALRRWVLFDGVRAEDNEIVPCGVGVCDSWPDPSKDVANFTTQTTHYPA